MRTLLSSITDHDGYKIERHIGDNLKITDKRGREVDDATRDRLTTWYWNAVAEKGNDPETPTPEEGA